METVLNMKRFRLLTRIFVASLFLVPLFFTTTASEFFELPKEFLLYIGLLVALLMLGLKFLLQKKISLVRTGFDLPLLLIFVSLSLSTYFGANRVQSLLNGLMPLGVGILLYLVVVQLLDPIEEDEYKGLIHVFIAVTTLLAFLSFLSYFNLSLFPFSFAKDRFFTPAGSNLTLLALLGISNPLALSLLLRSDASPRSPWYYISAANLLFFGLLIVLQASVLGLLAALPTLAMLFLADKEVTAARRSLFGPMALVLVLVAVLFYAPLNFNQRFIDYKNSFPRPITLNGRSSWIISIQAVRDYPFFGSGPASFLSDYVRYRPITLNYTPYWTQRFTQPFAEPYQVLATLGILGFLAFLFFFYQTLKTVVKLLSQSSSDGIGFSTLSFLIVLLFAVPSPSLRAVFFVLLAIYSLKSLPLIRKEFNIFPIIPLILAAIITVSVGYPLYNIWLAEFNFKKAVDAVLANDTNGAINGISAAIRLNPNRDNYHLSFASLTYTLANNLAAKKDLTEADRQTLMQLLNTSIIEAKSAVNLDPFNGTNLETLATIYRNVSGAVENAGSWAVTAYQQAMQIEPANPDLPFQLGSLLYMAGNYEQAANFSAQATNLKNDLPNYHYNPAWALRNRGLLDQAINEMTTVSRLTDPQTNDGKKVLADLQDFLKLAKDLRAGQQPTGGSQLGTPSPEGNLAQPARTPVNLPSEASPSNVKKK